MAKALHPIDALRARESAILARLSELNAQTWIDFDESEHRAKIASARADHTRGLIAAPEVEALVKARDEARAAAESEAAARAAAQSERQELADELNSVRAALEVEIDAQRARRRDQARDIFGRTAERFSDLIEQAFLLLPELVASDAAAQTRGSLPHMPRIVQDLYLPVFGLEPDGRLRFEKRIYDPKATESAIESLNTRLESVE